MVARPQGGGREGGGLRGRGRGGQQAGRAGPPPRRLLNTEGTQGESLTGRHLALLPTPAELRPLSPESPAPRASLVYAPPPRPNHHAAVGGEQEPDSKVHQYSRTE
ncbi:homeobox protein Hox-C13-like [Mesocricetus auratus]|uniref:Homeobox protein Hox-C13-like n=1 Tax=Mesocricetus auratus TaxID=10036 RepID=A0ABM2XJN0_MESAU|nr:homeobox protein Hox-C13-like [Mesocricetus auratus]